MWTENNSFQPNFQDTPPLDLENVSETLLEKNIQASQMTFGFLGLGIMGSGIVKNLINSGHKVVVWNRTAAKVSDIRCLSILCTYLFTVFIHKQTLTQIETEFGSRLALL